MTTNLITYKEMTIKRIFPGCLLALAALAANAQTGPQTLSIDLSKTYQTMEGFGASDAWTAEYVGTKFETQSQENAVKWLFGRGFNSIGNPTGIGLSIWRVNVGAGSASQGDASGIEDETRRAACFLQADGTYDWTQAPGQQWFMQQALGQGVESIVLFSNSPPIYYTKNGKAVANQGEPQTNLKADCYDDFARFLATVALHFEEGGFPVSYVSPLNEPSTDWTGGQEGSPWQNANIAQLAKELDKAFSEQGVGAKVLLTESDSWDKLTGGTGRARNQLPYFYGNQLSSGYLGNLQNVAKSIAAHSYWTFSTNDIIRSTREKARDMATKYGLGLQQTEWSMLDAAPSTDTGFPASYDEATYMDIALFMAKLIQCDLRFADVTSWCYWTAMSTEVYGQKNRFHLLRLNPVGGDYAPLSGGGTVNQTKNLWALGNFSRFVRPGYQRVELTGADEMNGLLGTAFKSPADDEVVVVVVNTGTDARSIDLDLADENLAIKSPVMYRTNDRSNLSHTDLQPGETYDIPARSVVTFVLKTDVTNGIESVGTEERSTGRPMGGNAVYTIDGKRLDVTADDLHCLPKGVYIVGGKKHINP